MKTFLYRPVDIEVPASIAGKNPFFVDVEGRFVGPDGSMLRIPGFYAGNGVWIIRFAPTTLGTWTYSLRSYDLADVDGRSGTVSCEKGSDISHGCLRVDESHRYHFVFDDGTHHFMNAYECDWLWALDLEKGDLTKTEELVDIVARYRFNTIIMNVYAYDTAWTPGTTSEYDYGPSAMCPWLGTNDEPDHTQFNTRFFEHFDRVVDLLDKKGMMIHLFFKVYNKEVKWPEPYSPEDDLYFKYVVARYQAYSNLVWDFSKESKNEPDKDYLHNRLNFIRSLDAYRHLVTTHDDPGYLTTETRRRSLDFITAQQHTNYFYSALAAKEKYRVPYFNSEFGYEHGPGGMDDYTYGVRHKPEELLERAYEVVMGGGYPAYYYTNTAWDVIDYRYEPPGYRYFEILYDFFTSIEWWRFEPNLEIAQPNSAVCLARKTDELVLFPGLRDRDRRDIFLTAPLPYEAYSGFWMDTFSGDRTELARGDLQPNTKGLMIQRIPFESRMAILYLKRNAT